MARPNAIDRLDFALDIGVKVNAWQDLMLSIEWITHAIRVKVIAWQKYV